jgi:group I intron endonuclease
MITNLKDNKRYVGQTTQSIYSRLNNHINEKRNRHISNAIRQYGIENFRIDVICSCLDQTTLNKSEVHFVKEMNSLHPYGYNHRAGGNQNGICSDELRMKISKAKIGKPLLKRRGEVRSNEQRIQISRSLGGQKIKATNLDTNVVKIYETAHSTKLDGHNPSNVVAICKKSSRRSHSKRWTFEYLQANQSGSTESKITEHAQRIGIDPTSKVE